MDLLVSPVYARPMEDGTEQDVKVRPSVLDSVNKWKFMASMAALLSYILHVNMFMPKNSVLEKLEGYEISMDGG